MCIFHALHLKPVASYILNNLIPSHFSLEPTDGFTTKDLIYEWHENKFAVSNDTEDVAQFAIPNIETLNKTATYATGLCGLGIYAVLCFNR